jgi:long-chain acyl-CoA synthetase
MFDLEKYGDHLCLQDEYRSLSYSTVNQATKLLASNLYERSLVLCLCENSIASLIGYITFIVHGHVPLMVDATQKLSDLLDIIYEYKPNYVWVSTNKIFEIEGCQISYRFEDYALLKLPKNDHSFFNMYADLQLLLSTSGSTGSKKFVRISKKNLLSNTLSIIQYLGIKQKDIAITTLPFSYSYGMSVINSHLLAGATIQVTKFNVIQKEFWEMVKNRNVTSLSGVPYTFDMLRRIKFERFQLDSVRYITQAGGKLNQDGLNYMQRISEEANILCFVMYGQTEASPRMSYLPAEQLKVKLGSIGMPIQNGYFELIDQNGKKISEPYLSGELIYYGPNVALGYASNFKDLANGDEWRGRLQTGDVGYFDKEGFYYITGRLKRFIKIYGNRTSLDEIESALLSFFKFAEFVCFGRDDCLVIGCVGTVDDREIINYVVRSFLINRQAIKFISLTEIPRLENGKPDFNSLSAYI